VNLHDHDNLLVDHGDLDNLISDMVKQFKLSQRSIEYLIYTQNYLKSLTISMETKFRKIKEECVQDKQKKSINDKNTMQVTSYNCTHCGKTLKNLHFLKMHYKVKHPEINNFD